MNFRNGQPIYVQIAERLMDEILANHYNVDERIPGVREYSVLLQVNVNTTVKAFEILTQRGIIYNKRGLGSFVSSEAKEIIHNSRREEILNQLIPDLARNMKQLSISLRQVTDRLTTLLASPHI